MPTITRPIVHSSLAAPWIVPVMILILAGPGAWGQAVKGSVPPDAPPPPLTYEGLIPGLDTLEDVREALGEPMHAARWYNYKMLYPSEDRPGMVDAVHMHGDRPKSGLANIEAAAIPEGFENEKAIRARLGEPEFELRMRTWKLLDYSEQGVRFSLVRSGKTTGVAYFPHTGRRVPKGERDLIDLSHLRQGPQPAPDEPAMPDGLRLGTAEVTITPTGEDWLAHPYKVHDDLKARIGVFTYGELTVALVGADLFGMGYKEVKHIREQARDLGIDHTIFSMSHTHSSGDTIGVYGHYPAEYIEHIQTRTLAGLEQALDKLAPVGQLRSASKELPMDGTRVMGLIRNARNPGLMDPTISVLQALDDDGEPMATIINFACHPETIAAGPREISADFVGYMCERVRENGGGQPIFLNGALGGMISGDSRERTHQAARRMGLKFAAIVDGLLEEAQPPAEFTFALDQRPLQIPLTNPRFEALFDTGFRPLNEGRVVTDMTYFQLGEAQLMTLPGEVLPEIAFEILDKMTGFPRMLIGLANDQLGYIIPPFDFRDDSYEESMSVGPAAAYQVRDMALRMIRESM